MSSTINFGIDLGTTNSAVAKYSEGKIEIFKNPLNLKQTLPSVVAFYRDRIIVGDKAREILQKDAQNVIGSFKRKMGTSDKYFIESKSEFLSAETLSSFVLKELKNFVHTGETIDASVITIPASFDTMQSNATKKAGYEAGFKQVVLLQEPIAASLAYANKTSAELNDKTWIVYDLGGGTFDVALVSIVDDEMKVVDHEGNNYLGGTDFDKVIIDKIIIPYLQEIGQFDNLEKELKSASGKYNVLYNLLLYKAEEVKIQLTNIPQAEIEFEITDDAGKVHDVYRTIERAQFEVVIKDQILDTTNLIDLLLSKNNVERDDVEFILMIGGSTYIPAVRNMLKENLGISINCDIDPTTAVAEGAAYYAGTKIKQIEKSSFEKKVPITNSDLQIRTAFSKVSKDIEAVFVIEATGEIDGKNYRITRQDKGFDSGLKSLQENSVEYLPLVPNVFNEFTFQVYDSFNNVVPTDVPAIGIMHGKFSIDGQPLPNDICLEVDALEQETTFLEPVFQKNTVLPLKKTVVKTLSRNIRKDTDDNLIINVLEGPVETLPGANKTIGFIKISGYDLTRDLIKNSDVELTFEMSESRDLRVEVYLTVSGQEFENVFSPSETNINLDTVAAELEEMKVNLTTKLSKVQNTEAYRELASIQNVLKDIEALEARLDRLENDDVTDEKYQIDEAKRSIAKRVHQLFNVSLLQKALEKYYKEKETAKETITLHAVEVEFMPKFENIIADEKGFIRSENVSIIKMKTTQLKGITNAVYAKNTPPPSNEDIISYYEIMKFRSYRDQRRADTLFARGDVAVKQKDIGTLIGVINDLTPLQSSKDDDDVFKNRSTGLK